MTFGASLDNIAAEKRRTIIIGLFSEDRYAFIQKALKSIMSLFSPFDF